MTNWPDELAEAALAHVISDKTVAAYQRGTMLKKRGELMAAWANYCEGADGENVVQIGRGR